MNGFSLKNYPGLRLLLYLFLAFSAGCLVAGLLLNRQRSPTVGELDSRYALEYARAAETIGRLEAELERERELTRELREYNEGYNTTGPA